MPSPPPLRRASSAPARLGRMSPTAVNRLALMLGNIRLHAAPMNVNRRRRMSTAAANRLALLLGNMRLHAAPMNVNNPRKRRRNLTVRRSPGGDKKRARR